MYFLRLLILCSICVSIQSTVIPQELAIRPFNIEDEAAHQNGKQTKGLNGLMKRLRIGGFSSGSRGGSSSSSSSGSSSGSRGSGSRTGAGVGAGLGAGAAAGHRHRNSSSPETSSANSSRLSQYDLFRSPINIAIALFLTLTYAYI